MKWLLQHAGRLLLMSAVIDGLLLFTMKLEGDSGDPPWSHMSLNLKMTIIIWWIFAVIFIVSFVLFFYQIGRGTGKRLLNGSASRD